MRSTKKSSTRPAAAGTLSTPTQSPRTPAENAFSARYLERSRRLPEPPFLKEALFAGPWDVEAVPAGDGTLFAVVRVAEPVAERGRAVAVFLRRADALVAAAALTALAVPNRLSLNTAGEPSSRVRRRLGFPLHDGREHLGHLSRPEEALLPYLHAVRCLVASPAALALALEAIGGELPPLVGRALMRRLAESE